jgi:NhaA family Na+:H+ antiporter
LWLCHVPQVLAGIILGVFIPLKYHHRPVAIKIAKKISPIVNFFVLPIFIFANTGLNFNNFQFEYFLQPMIISVVLSVLVGKQMGFLLFIFVINKLKITQIPQKIGWLKVYCLAIFSSVGFSCGLFFNSVLFKDNIALLNQTKLSLILVNFFIAVWGLLLVFFAKSFRKK